MATAAEQVAASQQRNKVPTEWQIVFQDWTNGSLLSLSNDADVSPSLRAYAGWELDYRIAFDISVEDPSLPPDFVHPDYEAKLEAHRQQAIKATQEADMSNADTSARTSR